jgi:hypothetical protein
MCKFKVLEHSEHGFVALCKGCNILQIVCGNVAIIVNEPTFNAFVKMINQFANEKQFVTDRELRNIYLESPCRNMHLVFSANELDMLNQLLSQASLLIQAQKMLAQQANGCN